MPTTTTIIKARTKIYAGFQYPTSGRVKIQLKSNVSVDVFLAPNEVAEGINSRDQGAAAGAIVIPNRISIENEIFPLPPQWKSGWKLMIGNPSNEDAAVYYDVLQG